MNLTDQSPGLTAVRDGARPILGRCPGPSGLASEASTGSRLRAPDTVSGSGPRLARAGLAGLAGLALVFLLALLPAGAAPVTNAQLVEWEGQVKVSRAGMTAWENARTNQWLLPGDRVRTRENSRAVLRMSDLSTIRLGPNTRVHIPDRSSREGGLEILRGLLYYFHRNKPGSMPVRTPSAYAVSLGTEFAVSVGPGDETRFDVIEGRVEITNALDRLTVVSGEAALVEPGRKPVRTPALPTVSVVQWVLYYPAVLDPDELRLAPVEAAAWAESLAAYRKGDLRRALDVVPPENAGESVDARILRAALWLVAGEVTSAESVLASLLDSVPGGEKLALIRALQTVIAAVRHRPGSSGPEGAEAAPSPLAAMSEGPLARWTTTAALAESYYQQAQLRLGRARELARQATVSSPEFGPAWARLAELEFSFGERRAAERALQRALELSPRHAQAHALQGFVDAAGNRIGAARLAFERAIELDGALGYGWLGRGLCRIRRGDRTGGVEDLQVAATVEPQRAMFRSYLAKAWGETGHATLARHEVELARTLDPADPTGWFYSALLNRERNEVNRAILDLERAVELNDGRQVYRSRVLLDQDAAVQGVHLAGMYDDAGLVDWSAYVAGRAVQLDPASHGAHLFLGDSHQRQRDPGRVHQRYETAAVSEHLLANLLAPVGAGTLAQTVTANEFSSLFESDGPGFASATEYLSRGAWTESAAYYGTLGRSSFALSGYYRTDPGQRANNDSEQHEVSARFKQQVTEADSVYFEVAHGAIEGGDLSARQDPATANTTVRIHEEQEPIVVGGYHRQWGPGQHTLALAGWVDDVQQVENDRQGTLWVDQWPTGTNINYVLPAAQEQRYRARAELFTVEVQQIWQGDRQAGIVGARFQDGSLEVTNASDNLFLPLVPGPTFQVPSQRIDGDLRRASGYGYYHLEAWPGLLLVAGLSYDWLRYPVNFRYAPLFEGEAEADQLSPKGGVVWRPGPRTTVRSAYAQSLGGAGFDQSIRLEPTQVAGFNQAWRSLIPESVAGANSAATFETMGAAVEQRVGRGTYLSLSGEWLRSGVERDLGVYSFDAVNLLAPSSTRERLAYDERTLVAAAHQLWGDDWAFGVRYRLSDAELRSHYTDFPATLAVPVPGAVAPRSEAESRLHQVQLLARYHHPSGFFAVTEGLWNRQMNDGTTGSPDESFWQCNLQAGWRGWRRRLEVRVGVLNVFDRDYRLNPLNLAAELPRERTLMVSGRFQF